MIECISRYVMNSPRLAGKLTRSSIKQLKNNCEWDQYLDKALLFYGIRAVWFITGDGAPSKYVPSITTLWDCNWRINSFLPEYSFTRYGFDELDTGVERIVLKSSYIITGTEVGKKQISHFYGVPEEKIRVIPFFPPPLERFKEEQFEDSTEIEDEIADEFVLYPSIFIPYKNHITLIKALKYLKETYSVTLKAILVGRDMGNMIYIKDRINLMGLQDQVTITGVISASRLVKLYKKALCLTYCTLNGPDNLPPLEAFSFGCPVIASSVPGAEEQLGDSAILFEPLNYKQLADAIFKMHTDLNLRNNYKKKGKERLETRTADNYIDNIVKLFDDLSYILDGWDGNNIDVV